MSLTRQQLTACADAALANLPKDSAGVIAATDAEIMAAVNGKLAAAGWRPKRKTVENQPNSPIAR